MSSAIWKHNSISIWGHTNFDIIIQHHEMLKNGSGIFYLKEAVERGQPSLAEVAAISNRQKSHPEQTVTPACMYAVNVICNGTPWVPTTKNNSFSSGQTIDSAGSKIGLGLSAGPFWA